ncbi:MAG: hypothetical protein KJ914_18295 [Gammaproteobacteria bacterium]|nr:hypothetical protein [Gammaproteobacteria bacterium]MBU1725895.1 hypothetical protein [Gammaproteobacteria bacterium]MBU2006399.1 hypothetical protein [Gammaproteobacteria bacterium]
MALLWLLAAVGIFMFARGLPRFLDRFHITNSETRLLIMIAFTGVILFGTANFLWNLGEEKPKSLPEPQPEEASTEALEQEQPAPDDVDGFVALNYRNLHDYRSSLKRRLKELHSFFFKDVKKWGEQSPQQRGFLQNIIDIRWPGYEEMQETDAAVDLSLREFWIHYQTGQSRYVAKVFEEEANLLIEKIKDAQAFDNTADKSEQEEIDKLLTNVRKQLENKDIPRDPKNSRKELKFTPYTSQNRQMLLDWLQTKQEGTLVSSLEILGDNQNKIEESLRQIHEYLKNPDNAALRQPMIKIIELWQAVGRYNLYAQYQILNAVEAEYLVEKLSGGSAPALNAAVRQPPKAARDLHVRLLEVAPQIAQRAISRRVTEVEQSYSPTTFTELNKKKR